MKRRKSALEPIFNPKSIAVIGASDNPGKLGFHVMKSLTQGGYSGNLFPVNPGKNTLFGIKAFPSLLQVPQGVDLSIIVLPAELVPKTIEECHDRGVKGIILITAGFKEIEDRKGELLQREVTGLANRFRIPIIGPNTFGIINLPLSLNASFTPEFSLLKKGGISFVSQSGGMSHLMGFLAMEHHLGMSKIIGLGNRCNVDFADMVEYLAEDRDTEVISMYLEGIDDPRKLLKIARRVGRRKPLVAFKVGRSRTSDRASRLHTGSLAGSHAVYEGALRQGGILTVGSSEELLDTAKALMLSPLPGGNRVAVLSGQAGPGMAACDACEAAGLSIPSFSPEVQKKINRLLPPLAIRTNPVDMGPAWYNAEATQGIVSAVLEDKAIDGILLMIMFASANRSAVGTLKDLLLSRNYKKPVLCCFCSPGKIWEEETGILEDAGVPNYPTPERATRAFANLFRFRKIRERSHERTS